MSDLFSVHQTKISELPELLTSNGSHITMIMCLYSTSSPSSIQFLQSIPDNLKPYLYCVSIDNTAIRSKILKSKNIKINELPCILVADTTTTVSVFEGDNISNIMRMISINYTKMISDNATENFKMETTPLSKLKSKKVRFEKIDDTESEDEEPQERVHKKTKMSRNPVNRPMDDKILKPKKGQYHDKMAKSSLNIGLIDKADEEDNGNNSRNIMRDYNENENDSSDEELKKIRTDFGLGGHKQKKSEHVKSLAATLEAERNLDSKLANEKI